MRSKFCFLTVCLIITSFANSIYAEEIKATEKTNEKVEEAGKTINSKDIISSYFPKTSQTKSPSGTLGFSDFFTSFLFLLLVILLIYLLAWFFQRTGLSPGTGNQLIKIVSAIPLGHKEKIALIEVGNQQVLVGISPGNIQKIMVLETPIKVENKTNQANPVQFSAQLFNSLKKQKNDN